MAMMTVNWHDYIATDPAVCHGKPCIRGTRILVSTVLDNLAAGESHAAIVASYEGVSESAIRAVVAYAAELARERTIALS